MLPFAMIDHDKRNELAQEIVTRIADRLGTALLLGGVYGSTARGSDTPWSDLELLFITRPEAPLKKRCFMEAGVCVGTTVMAEPELLTLLSQPSDDWAFWMGVLEATRVLHGKAGQIDRWMTIGKTVPAVAFADYVQAHWPGYVVESYGRIHSCLHRGNTDDLYCAVIEVLMEMQQVICLLNQRWVTHDYAQGLADTFDYESLPELWRELALSLWRERDPQVAAQNADKLVTAYWHWLGERGIDMSASAASDIYDVGRSDQPQIWRS